MQVMCMGQMRSIHQYLELILMEGYSVTQFQINCQQWSNLTLGQRSGLNLNVVRFCNVYGSIGVDDINKYVLI